MVEMNRKEVLEGIVLVEDLRSQALKKFEETTVSDMREKRDTEVVDYWN